MPCAPFSKVHDQPADSKRKATLPMVREGVRGGGHPPVGETGEAGRVDKESGPARLDSD